MIVFVVPVHGRHALAEACLGQLARVCAETAADVVLVGDERFFEALAGRHGFAYVRAANRPLGRKWNDGIEYACRELAAEFVVPFGSDDIIDPRLLGMLPGPDTILCRRHTAVVSEDGAALAELEIPYKGGDGVRVYPAALLRRVGFRPAADNRDRAIDGSISDRLGPLGGGRPLRYEYFDLHPLQIVDFKTSGPGQRNTYQSCLKYATAEHDDTWQQLAMVYPSEFVAEMESLYARGRVVAA